MFEQTFVDGTGKTNKPWTVALSFFLQVLLILVAVLIPLIYTDTLPRAVWENLARFVRSGGSVIALDAWALRPASICCW